MLLNDAAQIEETALPFLQFALLHSLTSVQLRLITILGNRGCVAVSSFLGVPSALQYQCFWFYLHLRRLKTKRCSNNTGVTRRRSQGPLNCSCNVGSDTMYTENKMSHTLSKQIIVTLRMLIIKGADITFIYH
jgi:hypothetical protein